ncbi:Forkhead-associated protein [Candidatus Protofrankia datiscae]|uniref:Forkhead-associated protein n=2 Tax=Frankiaceae TaxID=74712 RepID=F8AXW3_9ACTN|nr:Forkhead-associated protein [Candidatus Protofrankia datiscae]
MSARCPDGHLSLAPDYCDQCGMRIVANQEPYVIHPADGTTGSSGRGRPHQPDHAAGGHGEPSYGRRPAEGSGPLPAGPGQSGPNPSLPGDPFGRDGYAQDGYDSAGHLAGGYGASGYGRDPYGQERYSSSGYPPDPYAQGGYGADGYPPDPYRDPRGEPSDEPYRADLWGYERADPYRSPAPPAPGTGGVDDPYGLDRGAAARPSTGAPATDYHRPPPNQAGFERPARDVREPVEGYAACPNCHNPNEVGARFCEVCGFDLVLLERPAPVPAEPRSGPSGPLPVQASWDVVVEAEREYYDSGDDHRVPFPTIYPRRVFALNGSRLLIGRRSESRGIHPEIDLAGAPEDPGISRAHAMLELLPDGSYAVLDPGSTNGTRINDEPNPIPPGQPIPLHHGDRVYLGAWTRVTIRSR